MGSQFSLLNMARTDKKAQLSQGLHATAPPPPSEPETARFNPSTPKTLA